MRRLAAEILAVDGPTPAYRDELSRKRGRIQAARRIAEQDRREHLLRLEALERVAATLREKVATCDEAIAACTRELALLTAQEAGR